MDTRSREKSTCNLHIFWVFSGVLAWAGEDTCSITIPKLSIWTHDVVFGFAKPATRTQDCCDVGFVEFQKVFGFIFDSESERPTGKAKAFESKSRRFVVVALKAFAPKSGFSMAVVVVVVAYWLWLLVLAGYLQMLDECRIIALFYYRCAALMRCSQSSSSSRPKQSLIELHLLFLCCWGNGKLTADEFIDYVFGTEVSGSNQKLLGDLTQNHVDCFDTASYVFPFWMRCNLMANLGVPLF